MDILKDMIKKRKTNNMLAKLLTIILSSIGCGFLMGVKIITVDIVVGITLFGVLVVINFLSIFYKDI